ncbi:MAG: hypothetical protein SFY32_14070 [Bacteroidota bacterium]|nr:hypothetical protein [Bacteroidota bacterium]
MAFTKRKENRLKMWDKYNTTLKKYSKQPLIKNVDIEELKKQFASKAEAAQAPKTKKAAVESVETELVAAPEATVEAKPKTKKAAAESAPPAE